MSLKTIIWSHIVEFSKEFIKRKKHWFSTIYFWIDWIILKRINNKDIITKILKLNWARGWEAVVIIWNYFSHKKKLTMAGDNSILSRQKEESEIFFVLCSNCIHLRKSTLCRVHCDWVLKFRNPLFAPFTLSLMLNKKQLYIYYWELCNQSFL